MRYLFVIALLVGMVACSNEPKEVTETTVIDSVKAFEDSLKSISVDVNALTDQKIGVAYAEKCLEVYHRFPKSKEAPKYLDKAHIIFASLGMHGRSVALADTLIMKYPAYENRPMVLESLATAYDIYLQPRKKEKVEKYYQLLLKENPNLPKEKKEDIEFRLENINLSFEELIMKRAGSVN